MAELRAAELRGYNTFKECKADGWNEVVKWDVNLPVPPRETGRGIKWETMYSEGGKWIQIPPPKKTLKKKEKKTP